MSSNLEKAIKILKDNHFTFVAVNENNIISDDNIGIKPLMNLIENKVDLKGYSVADKVIGKAAAFLYILLNVNEVYVYTVSKHALSIFNENNVTVYYEKLVDNIINRDKTGICPMEKSVIDISEAHQALEVIRSKLLEVT